MGAFKYQPPHETAARHRDAKVSSREGRQGEQKNVEAVLSLGSSRYFTYRNYLLRVPPVPFKVGQQVLALYVRSLESARKVARTGDAKAMDEYYAVASILVDVLWENVEPATRFRRVLKRMHLLRNVFRIASEKEVTELTSFFLQCRMMSTVQATEENLTGPSTPTLSMSSKSS